MSKVPHPTSRRDVLLGGGALFAWACLPRVARAAGRDPRLLVIVLRGALDGLDAVAPVGDPGWVALRGEHALRLDGPAAGLPLDSVFALNPAMPNLHRLYRNGALSVLEPEGRANPRNAVAIGPIAPLIVRGPAPVSGLDTCGEGFLRLRVRRARLYVARGHARANPIRADTQAPHPYLLRASQRSAPFGTSIGARLGDEVLAT
jgi:uncharacterized protein (DUF1501 family)